MTDEVFTASNGITVTIDNRGRLLAKGGVLGGVTHATGGAHFRVQALREYFQHERDQELGRWRDPENPDYVVYSMGGGTGECWVFNEKDLSEYEHWTRDEVARGVYPTVFGYDTAKRYFDAHPETKPWHDARPREVWLVTVEGEEPEPMLVRGRKIYGEAHRFMANEFYDLLVTDPRITHAEKIYPREEKQ